MLRAMKCYSWKWIELSWFRAVIRKRFIQFKLRFLDNARFRISSQKYEFTSYIQFSFNHTQIFLVFLQILIANIMFEHFTDLTIVMFFWLLFIFKLFNESASFCFITRDFYTSNWSFTLLFAVLDWILTCPCTFVWNKSVGRKKPMYETGVKLLDFNNKCIWEH